MDSAGHGKTCMLSLYLLAQFSMAALFIKHLSTKYLLYLVNIWVPITFQILCSVLKDIKVKAKQIKIKQLLLWIRLGSIGEDDNYSAWKMMHLTKLCRGYGGEGEGLPRGHSWTESGGTSRSQEKAAERGHPCGPSQCPMGAQSISGTHLLFIVFILGLPRRFVNIFSDSKPILWRGIWFCKKPKVTGYLWITQGNLPTCMLEKQKEPKSQLTVAKKLYTMQVQIIFPPLLNSDSLKYVFSEASNENKLSNQAGSYSL